MKMLCYLYIFFIAITTAGNFVAGELTEIAKADIEKVGQVTKQAEKNIKPKVMGKTITSASAAVEAIDKDLQMKANSLAQGITKQSLVFRGALDTDIGRLTKFDPKNPLIPILSQLSDEYKLAYGYQAQLARLEHIADTIESVTKKNKVVGDQLLAKNHLVYLELENANNLFKKAQQNIEKINESVAGTSEEKMIQYLKIENARIQSLTTDQLIAFRLQQYDGLTDVLDSLAAATKDIPGAAAAINDLKTMEARLHAIDQEITDLEAPLGDPSHPRTPTTPAEQTALSRIENLKKQRAALQQQYSVLMKQKHGSVLQQIALTKSNILQWVKKNPRIVVSILLGTTALAGSITGIVLLVKSAPSETQPQQPSPRRGASSNQIG